MEVQASLRGVWQKDTDCPHRHGFPEGPDRCDAENMSVCGYELGNGFRCEIFAEILEEWKEQLEI